MEIITGKNDENSVRKCKYALETLGNVSKRGLLFSNDVAIHGPQKKNVRKRPFFPTHCFYTFPGTNSAEGPIPKVLIMRWKRC